MLLFRSLIQEDADTKMLKLCLNVLGKHRRKNGEVAARSRDHLIIRLFIIAYVRHFFLAQRVLYTVDIPRIHVVGCKRNRVERADGVNQ